MYYHTMQEVWCCTRPLKVHCQLKTQRTVRFYGTWLNRKVAYMSKSSVLFNDLDACFKSMNTITFSAHAAADPLNGRSVIDAACGVIYHLWITREHNRPCNAFIKPAMGSRSFQRSGYDIHSQRSGNRSEVTENENKPAARHFNMKGDKNWIMH
jgi:hypothetical protein